MNATELERQIEKLRVEPDHGARNKLALDLAETRNPAVKAVLVELILRPDLVNRRGTLVYALSGYDNTDLAPLLIDLVITGNFEVAHEALLRLCDIEAAGVLKSTPPTTVFSVWIRIAWRIGAPISFPSFSNSLSSTLSADRGKPSSSHARASRGRGPSFSPWEKGVKPPG